VPPFVDRVDRHSCFVACWSARAMDVLIHGSARATGPGVASQGQLGERVAERPEVDPLCSGPLEGG